MFRTILAASAVALVATSAAAQQGTYVSVEGGLACITGKTIATLSSGDKVGDDGCGGRGTLEIGRTGVPIFGLFDHWALRARYSRSKDSESVAVGASVVDAGLTDKRTVLDAELGAKLPFSPLGFLGLQGTTRATLGVRYVDWEGDLLYLGVSGPLVGISEQYIYRTTGWGGRIGLRSNMLLGTHWMIESNSGFSLLQGRGKISSFASGVLFGESTDKDTFWSFDSTTLLSYKLNGTESGPVLSVGMSSDYYFKQIPGATDDVKRFNWGPVARVRVPLGQ